jgi:hypothetical protein
MVTYVALKVVFFVGGSTTIDWQIVPLRMNMYETGFDWFRFLLELAAIAAFIV